MISKISIFLFSFLIPVCCFSQEEAGQAVETDNHLDRVIHSPYRLSFRLNAVIPHPIGNPAFKMSFNGIYDCTGSLNLELLKGINIGVVFKNALFITPPNKIRGLNTKIQYNAGGVRVGYDFYITRITVFSGVLNLGQCYMDAQDIVVLKPTTRVQKYSSGFYLEPEVALSFYTEDNFAIGFNVSYQIITNQFDPYALALDQHSSYLDSDLAGFTQNLCLGFHFAYSFLKKRKKK